MCMSIKTTMACGHTFTNYATTCCTASASRPCTPDVKVQYLDDTCAACDPEARRRRVRLDYESRHAELMALYIAAKRSGDGDAMARVEQLVMENARTTMERNFEISPSRRDESVMWWEMDSE
ncbi:hypothetical protein FSOLCH5_005670 [Fusarium solani]|uniref:Uncharacterized protein n=2 Tax=Fusarium solani species complex TaxID=232080 RepID=A0A9W8RE80_9HYPO|nr:hypothetical protein NCS55_00275100 [Fusarium keratoplasticum]KAJ3465534.1 hypothetical protein MRS44_006192 [Fusarium solani]KAJ4149812.1 hypothetical protein NW754_001245 [Fusarium falciforme]KAJ4192842.1 hypothetical protein NW755_003991 [Fusarium falciforme]KAJ4210378.1 hypothetical protein NW767_000647 [Fusarium falciforme]